MTVFQPVGAIKRFKRTPWRFQQTIEVPSGEKIPQFVSAIIATLSDVKEATVTIVEIVFDVSGMEQLLGLSGANRLSRESSVTADGAKEIEQLLTTALLDANDFILKPDPKPFVIFAAHHGWTTFYANTRSNLNGVIVPLEAGGFKLVQNWQRDF